VDECGGHNDVLSFAIWSMALNPFVSSSTVDGVEVVENIGSIPSGVLLRRSSRPAGRSSIGSKAN